MAKQREGIQEFEIIADLGGGLVLCKIDINLLREQNLNARLMKDDMFKQLVANIRKRGSLESLPYCVKYEGKFEIISGHHRIKAAKEAGLKTIPVLLDISGLNRSQIAAKQLAHNSISGFDDQDILREISKIIDNVDDKLEAFIDTETDIDVNFEPLNHIETEFDWKQISLIFLQHEVQELDKLWGTLEQKPDYLGVAHLKDFENFVQTIKKTQKFEDVKNLSSAVYAMIDIVNKHYDKEGYVPNKPYMAVSKIMGISTVPKKSGELIKKAVKKMVDSGEVTFKWQALEKLAKDYLKESE